MPLGPQLPIVVAIAFLMAVSAQTLPASAQVPASDTQIDSRPLIADNDVVRASLNRLFARSATWRSGLDLVQKTGRRAYVVTPDRVRIIDPQKGGIHAFDRHQLAETIPILDDEHRVDVVVVVVNVRLLQEMHWARGPLVDFERDLDRILAHEIYAHTIPYLITGHISGRCADPLPDQPAAESCAIRRENEVRLELGLGTRRDYGLESLALLQNPRRESFR